MTRARGPPRGPSRDSRPGQGPSGPSENPETPGSDSRAGGYRLIAAQQPNATAGFEGARYPPPPAAPLPPPPPPPPYPSAPPYPTTTRTNNTPTDTENNHHQTPATADPSADLIGDESAALAEYPYSIYNHGTWTADDDRTLIQARTRGQNWAELQRTHFPTKTANACRKRYERLVERRGIHDYSGRRLEAVANEYMGMRREIWSGLADRLGMKWEVVEALCMGAGIRTIQSNARSYTNRARRDNRISQQTRDAQADARPLSMPLPLLPVGSEFGTAFGGHGGEGDRGLGAADRCMPPPPPFFPTSSGPPPSCNAPRLPPMVLAPQDRSQLPFRGYLNGDARSMGGPPYTGGPAPEPPPACRPPDW